jgi:hypothetical protein
VKPSSPAAVPSINTRRAAAAMAPGCRARRGGEGRCLCGRGLRVCSPPTRSVQCGVPNVAAVALRGARTARDGGWVSVGVAGVSCLKKNFAFALPFLLSPGAELCQRQTCPRMIGRAAGRDQSAESLCCCLLPRPPPPGAAVRCAQTQQRSSSAAIQQARQQLIASQQLLQQARTAVQLYSSTRSPLINRCCLPCCAPASL